MADIRKIISCLDGWLENHKEQPCLFAPEANEVLDRAGLLSQSASRPGAGLRKLLRAGKLPHAYQIGDTWYIPHSRGLLTIPSQNKNTKSMPNNFAIEEWDDVSFMDQRTFKNVRGLKDSEVPDKPGLYAIRIEDVNALPFDFSRILEERGHNILYIGKTEVSLLTRMWEQELHQNGAGTFFRSIGSVLGFVPEPGSLEGKKNKKNYKFSKENRISIVRWIEDHLLINFVPFDGDVESVETKLIQKYVPLLNIDKNPLKSEKLEELRDRCRKIARGEE